VAAEECEMKIELRNGVRYTVRVKASVGSALAMSMLKLRLQASGFDSISIQPERDAVTVTGRYTGHDQTIDLNYDVERIEAA
jgi:hypothetical protein